MKTEVCSHYLQVTKGPHMHTWPVGTIGGQIEPSVDTLPDMPLGIIQHLNETPRLDPRGPTQVGIVNPLRSNS